MYAVFDMHEIAVFKTCRRTKRNQSLCSRHQIQEVQWFYYTVQTPYVLQMDLFATRNPRDITYWRKGRPPVTIIGQMLGYPVPWTTRCNGFTYNKCVIVQFVVNERTGLAFNLPWKKYDAEMKKWIQRKLSEIHRFYPQCQVELMFRENCTTVIKNN